MSKIYNTVKTEKKAIKILMEHKAVSIKRTVKNCQCGESTAVQGFDNNYKLIGFVVVCKQCGDNEGFDLFNEK